MLKRSQLMALVDVHSSAAGFGGTLTEAELLIIRGALDLTAKTADSSMTPVDKVGHPMIPAGPSVVSPQPGPHTLAAAPG